MNDEPRGDRAEDGPDDGVADTFSGGDVKVPSAQRANDTRSPNSAEDGGDANRNPPRNFLRRLTISEWLTFLVGLGSLAVSALTWWAVSDTSDIKSAIRNLSDLASQSERQANAANRQIDEMRDEQRPWLRVVPQIKGSLVNNDGSLSTVIALNVRNLGHKPAVSVTGKAELNVGTRVFKSKPISEADIVSLCEEKIDPFWVAFAGDPGNDVIFPESDGVINVNAEERYRDGSNADKFKLIPDFEGKDFFVKSTVIGFLRRLQRGWG